MVQFNKIVPRCLLVGIAFLALLSVLQGFRNGLNFVDFHWESAALFLRGENPYQWFFDGRLFQGVYVDATQAPSTIAFILPYGLFNHFVGNMLWDVSNLLFVAMFLWQVRCAWFRNSPWPVTFVACLFLVGTPWRACIGNGQHVMFSFMFFMLSYNAMESNKSKWLMGALMAASLFKYTVAVPMAFVFLFRREWRAMFVCAGLHVALTVLLGAWTHTNPLTLVLQSMQIGGALVAHGDADIASLLRAFGCEDVKIWATAGYVIYGMLCVVVAFARTKDDLLKLATLAVISNVMFYHRVYDFVTLVFPVIWLVRGAPENDFKHVLAKCLIVLEVANVFFVGRILSALGLPPGTPYSSFVLEHLLLADFLWIGFPGGGSRSEASTPKSQSVV